MALLLGLTAVMALTAQATQAEAVLGEPYVAIEVAQVPDMIGPGQTGTVVFIVHVVCPDAYVATERGHLELNHNNTGPATTELLYDGERTRFIEVPCNIQGKETRHRVEVDVTVAEATEAYDAIQVHLEALHSDASMPATGSAHIWTGRVGSFTAEAGELPDVIGEAWGTYVTVQVTNRYNTPLQYRILFDEQPENVRFMTQSSYVIGAARTPEEPTVADVHIEALSRPEVQESYNETVDLRIEAWELLSVAPVEERPPVRMVLHGVPDAEQETRESPAGAALVPPCLLGMVLLVARCRRTAGT